MVQSVMKVTENNGIIKISGVWIYKIFNKYIRRGVNILYTISIWNINNKYNIFQFNNFKTN